ncbi:MAG: polyprenol monophosphomannose synthase [Chthoniobacterales bacterium]
MKALASEQSVHDRENSFCGKAVVVIPAFNEADNIGRLIERLLNLPTPVDVLVVDDNSPDGTAAIVASHPFFNRRVFLLDRPSRLGFAMACRDGFRWSTAHDYDVCIEMDADFSHDPDDIPRLLAEIAAGADIAVGSRYLNGVRVINWPARRLLLSLFAGKYTRFCSGLHLSDPTSGFKAIRSRVVSAQDWSQFTADGYGFIIEFHFYSWRNGFDLREIPVVFTERRDGQSKMSFRIMRESAWRVARLGCSRLLNRRRQPADPVRSLGYA